VDDSTARIAIDADLPGVGAGYSMTYTIYGTGDIIVEAAYQPGSDRVAMMPRFGTELVAAPGLDNLTWYGRGPVETYIDRRFERIGVYRSTVNKEWVEYMRPQENGNKTDVRWVALTNAQGVGLMAVGSPALGVAARRYTKQDMEQAGYTFQMAPKPQAFVNLDARQMGVGGIDSWSGNAYPMEPYRIPSGQPHSYRYRLSPVDATVAMEKIARESF
jgi:beta-galactosidase